MILIGNWKMNTLRKDIEYFIQNLPAASQGIEVGFSAPFPYLEKTQLPKGYFLGAQDCSAYEKGAFTGQVSAAMAKDVGCSFVLVGHPEIKDTDDVVRVKAERVQAQGMIPVICLAKNPESIKERLPSRQKYIVAYEPAVGMDVLPPTLSQDVDILRQYIGNTPLLYGGGVTPETVTHLWDFFDGFLVGRLSLEIHKWKILMDQVAANGRKLSPVLG